MNASLLTLFIPIRIMQAGLLYILVDMTVVTVQQNRLHASAVTTVKTFFYLSLMSLTVSNINKKLTIS